MNVGACLDWQEARKISAPERRSRAEPPEQLQQLFAGQPLVAAFKLLRGVCVGSTRRLRGQVPEFGCVRDQSPQKRLAMCSECGNRSSARCPLLFSVLACKGIDRDGARGGRGVVLSCIFAVVYAYTRIQQCHPAVKYTRSIRRAMSSTGCCGIVLPVRISCWGV